MKIYNNIKYKLQLFFENGAAESIAVSNYKVDIQKY